MGDKCVAKVVFLSFQEVHKALSPKLWIIIIPMDITKLPQFSRAIPRSGIYLKAAFMRKITVINV